MTFRFGPAAVAGAFFSLALGPVHASPQVVGDEACARYAVDIAAFATCEDGRVVRPAEDAPAPPPPPARPLVWRAATPEATSALARTLLAALAVDGAAAERNCAAGAAQPR